MRQKDSAKKLFPPEDFEVLWETARLAPTSFGLETWKILVIQDKTLHEEMKEFGWGIKDKLDASHFVVFLARKKADITFGSDYIRHMLKDVHQVPDGSLWCKNAYGNFIENDFKTLESERALLTGRETGVHRHGTYDGRGSAHGGVRAPGFIPKEMDRLLGKARPF